MLVLTACTTTTSAPKRLGIGPPHTIPPSPDVCAAGPSCCTSYAGQDMHDVNFHAYPAGSLRGVNFDGADLRGASFEGQDLTGATFRKAILGRSDKGPAVFSHATLDHTCFREAVMNDAQLYFARIHCADFSKTSLMEAAFGPRQAIDEAPDCRTRFNEATLDVHAITPDHWRGIDFTKTDFRNFAPSNFKLSGLDLTGVYLAETNLPGIDMSGANLSGADLSWAKLVNAKLQNATFNGAKLIGTQLKGAQLQCARFYGLKSSSTENPNAACHANPDPDAAMTTIAADLTNAQLSDADLSNATMNGVQFHGAVLDRVTATNTSFIKASFISDEKNNATTFKAADLTGAKFTGAHVDYVNFKNLILTGADFSSTTMKGTEFTGSIMPNAVFDHSELQAVHFDNAILQAARFNSATLQTGPSHGPQVDFSCAQLGGADFTGAVVAEASFDSAVMPREGDCCAKVQDTQKCGTIDITGVVYGPAIPPDLTPDNHAITCPDESKSPCLSWAVPNWQSNRCNATGGTDMRTLWRKPDECSAKPPDVLVFSDPNLQKCVSDAIPDHPQTITKDAASKLRHLDCAGMGIADLTGLAALDGLLSLNLNGNHLTQFSLSLPNLHSLKIADNQLTTLQLGSQMARLVRLDASHNQLSAVGIDSSIALVFLDLSQNQLTSFDLARTNHSQLNYVDLSQNVLTTVLNAFNTDLSLLSQIQSLDLSNNNLTTIGTLPGTLTFLRLQCDSRFDCSTLGADATSLLVQGSGCAALNTQTNKWLLQAHPTCP